MNNNISNLNTPLLYTKTQPLIANVRTCIATVINQELIILYWSIGHHIQQDILKSARAKYKKFPDQTIFSAVQRELSWTHIACRFSTMPQSKKNIQPIKSDIVMVQYE